MQITKPWYTSDDPEAIAFREWLRSEYERHELECYNYVDCEVVKNGGITEPYINPFADENLASNLKLIEAMGWYYSLNLNSKRSPFKKFSLQFYKEESAFIIDTRSVEAETPTLASAQAIYEIYLQENSDA